MATIKSYTDISQSKKLVEILPLESADMCYMYLGTEDKKYQDIPICAPAMEGDLCAWSLVALLSVLPKPKVFYSTDKTNRWYCQCWDSDGNFITFTKATNPIDACYEMILKFHELNLL